ncbi:MAG: LysM peptidoglycan-binding domain-containing protein [Reichenbachiella sp.]
MKLWGEEYIVTAETFSYLKEARKIRYHRVRSGDTLSGIGYRYGISITKICRLNGISRKSILRIGQRLRIT